MCRKRCKDILEKSDMLFSSFQVQGLCLFLYKILVDVIYLLYIGPTFQYGIRIHVLNTASSYLYLGMYAIFFYEFVKRRTVSSVMFIVLNMIYFIPLTTYCSLGSGSSSFLFFAILYWTLLSVLQIRIPVIVWKRTGISGRRCSFLMYIVLAGVSIFTVYLSWKYTGFRIVTDLLEVYDIRAEAAGYDLSAGFRYLQSFSTILIPLLILFCFRQKKYVLVLWGTFLLILNFSFAGHKSVLFMGILVLAGAIFWRRQMVSWIVPGGIGVAILAMLEEKVFEHGYIISLFFRRMGYLLAQLSDEYYRYFRNSPTEIFRGTFLGKVGFERPYPLSLSYVIGNNYLSQIVSCNNGLLADVWSNMGIMGILVMPFILIICFRLFDMASEGLPTRYTVGLVVYYAALFSNGTWSTVVLTHGFLIMCFVFFMFPRDEGLEGERR
ncbi:MAG: hypothetical protein K2P64_04345 [Lachnospiraceae bacterium]|nr:hypothetical protein [Lachnospiraceae bacterium]